MAKTVRELPAKKEAFLKGTNSFNMQAWAVLPEATLNKVRH